MKKISLIVSLTIIMLVSTVSVSAEDKSNNYKELLDSYLIIQKSLSIDKVPSSVEQVKFTILLKEVPKDLYCAA